MKIIRAKDYNDMSRKAANIISAQVIMKPNCVLGLATGGTPVGTYKQLVEWYNKGDLDFAEVNTVNLEYFIPLTFQIYLYTFSDLLVVFYNQYMIHLHLIFSLPLYSILLHRNGFVI